MNTPITDRWWMGKEKDVVHRDTCRQLEASHALLLKCLVELYDRVDRNGGVGPYTGGPVFVMKNAWEAVEVARSIK